MFVGCGDGKRDEGAEQEHTRYGGYIRAEEQIFALRKIGRSELIQRIAFALVGAGGWVGRAIRFFEV